MKIAVIGAGIIGITTAYELAVDGHEVTVFERRGAAAEETTSRVDQMNVLPKMRFRSQTRVFEQHCRTLFRDHQRR